MTLRRGKEGNTMTNNNNEQVQAEVVNEEQNEAPVEVSDADKRVRLENFMKVLRMLDKREEALEAQRKMILQHIQDEIGKTFLYNKTVYQVRPRKGKLHLVKYFTAA